MFDQHFDKITHKVACLHFLHKLIPDTWPEESYLDSLVKLSRKLPYISGVTNSDIRPIHTKMDAQQALSSYKTLTSAIKQQSNITGSTCSCHIKKIDHLSVMRTGQECARELSFLFLSVPRETLLVNFELESSRGIGAPAVFRT